MPRSKSVRTMMMLVSHCFYCDREFYSKDHHKNCGYKTIDHIIPIIRGGRNIPNNMVVACNWCNNQKGNMELVDFLNKVKKIASHPKKSIIFKNSGIPLNTIIKNIHWVIRYIEPHKEALYESGSKINLQSVHHPHRMKLVVDRIDKETTLK
jgi:hypothetical protein